MGGNKIKELRDRAGLTQKALAEGVGISTRALISLEAKDSLVNRHVPKIAELTGSSEAELIGCALPADLETAARELKDMYEGRLSRTTQEYEEELAKLREKIALLESSLASKDKAISSLEKLNRMLESQLSRYENGDGIQAKPDESVEGAPTEQEIS